MDNRFLIDTNIIIYFLDDQIPENHVETLMAIFQNSFNISTITNIEVLGWHLLEGEKRVETEAFLENAHILFVDDAIQRKTIEIKKNRRMKTPDAIIGATAIVYDLTLVTRNESDFKHIREIKIYNPFK
jgi:predicted nucleic acid-binding protein